MLYRESYPKMKEEFGCHHLDQIPSWAMKGVLRPWVVMTPIVLLSKRLIIQLHILIGI
jgi:hypothetical protein